MTRSILAVPVLFALAACGGGDSDAGEDAPQSTGALEAQQAEVIPAPPSTMLPAENGDAKAGAGVSGGVIPNLYPLFDDIQYIDQPVEGVYAGHALVVLSSDSEERSAIKIVDLSTMDVVKTILVCCMEKGHRWSIDRALAAVDGTLYAGGSSPGKELYRSRDGGESWTQLGPVNGDPMGVSFQPIATVQMWDDIGKPRSGHYNHIYNYAVDGNGDVIVTSLYSGSRLGMIDGESGVGSFRDESIEEGHNLKHVELLATRSGHIFMSGTLQNDDYPSITLRSTNGGETFADITRGGEVRFRGASWNDTYLLRDPEVEGRYSLNGQRAGAALSTGITRSDNYWLYPNGLIGYDMTQLLKYSTDGGQTVQTFRPSENDVTIRTSGGHLYY